MDVAGAPAKQRLEPHWIANLGEQASHLVYHMNKTSKKYDVVVVGEQTFFVLNEQDGRIRYQRRLEFAPSCIATYHTAKDVFENEDRNAEQVLQQASQNTHDSPCFSFILGSFSNYLMVYRDVQLVWTAKSQTAPVFVTIARIDSQPGLMITLSDSGLL